MARLIVTRPRPSFEKLRPYRILIDGQVATSIGGGDEVEIALPPGRHRITARVGVLRSQPLEIEAGPEEAHHLLVRSHVDRRGPLRVAFFSTFLVPIATLSLMLAGQALFSDPFEKGWFTQFLGPMIWLPFWLTFASMIVWRDRILCLEAIPSPDPIGGSAVPPESRPLRIRITIRDLMIAVAIVAFLFWAGVEWTRFTRSDVFQKRASYHLQFENQFRGFERDLLRMAGGMPATSPNANPFRQSAAKAAAVAEYHAAMRRKYEEAAARQVFAVEPDPPAPRYP
jgi:hypothetical protein